MHVLTIAFLGLFLLSNTTPVQTAQLRFAASLPLGSEDDGEAARAVADVLRESVVDVNQRVARPAGHNVSLIILDSADSSARAVQNAFTITSPAIDCIGLIAEWTSDTTTAAALAASNLGIYTCTGTATSTDLSNKNEFPMLYRLIPDDSQQGRAIAQFVKSNWRACAVLASNTAYGRSIADAFIRRARELDLFVATSQVLQFHGLDEVTNNTAADQVPLQLVADSGVRIILFFGDLGELLHIIPLANEVGLIGSEYVWIASEAVAGLAEEARLDPALQRLVNGFMHAFPVEYANERDAQSLLKRVQLTSPDFDRLQPYGGFHRDCLFSLTVNFIEQLKTGVAESLVLSRSSMKTPLASFLRPFDGISGRVAFNANGDRLGTFTIFNLFEGRETPVFEVDPAGRIKQLAEPRFFSGTTTLPSDLPQSLVGFVRFSSFGGVLVVIANGVGILCIMVSLFYITLHRANSIVQEANLAVLLLVGLGLVMILGFSTAWIDVQTPATCHVSLWGIGLGLMVALLPLLYRGYWTWVVSENFTLRRRYKSHPPPLVKRIAPYGTLLTIQVLLLSLWSGIAPLRPQPLATRDSFSFRCRSADTTVHTVFQSVVFSLDTLLILALVSFSFSSRHLALPGNLPRYTFFAATNLLLSCLVLFPLITFTFPDFSIGSHYVHASVVVYTCLFTWGMIGGRVIQELRKQSLLSIHNNSTATCPLDRLCEPINAKSNVDPLVATDSLNAVQPELLPVAGKPRSFIGDFPVRPARFWATWRIHRVIVAQEEGYIGISAVGKSQGALWTIKQVFPVKSEEFDMALELFVEGKLAAVIQLSTENQRDRLFNMLAKRAW